MARVHHDKSASNPRGVVCVSASGDLPRPHLAIVGAIHGNEPCGQEALERLQRELLSGPLALTLGTLFLVHGNPEASSVRRRSYHGADLNRLFDYRFVAELERAQWQVEHHRALSLRPLLDSVDALLDLHSATAPTPPFAIASRVAASEPFASALGLDYVTSGWDGPGLLGDQVMLGALTRRERPAVAVECGQHDDASAPDVAYGCARAALDYFGMCPHTPAVRRAPAKRLVVRAAIKRPSESFRFSRSLFGMSTLAAGEEIGHGDYLTMSVRAPCYVIMPNDRVAVGDDMLYIAEEL